MPNNNGTTAKATNQGDRCNGKDETSDGHDVPQGRFAGEVPANQDMSAKAMPLKNARMAIYWATSNGVMELAEVGPNQKSKISAKADIPMLHDITAVFTVTAEAWEKWNR